MTRGRVLLALLMLWGLAMIVPDLSRIVQPLGSFGFYADNDGVIYDVTGPFARQEDSPAWQAGLRVGDQLDLAREGCTLRDLNACEAALAVIGGVQYVIPGTAITIPLQMREGARPNNVTVVAEERPYGFLVRAVLLLDQIAGILVIVAAGWLVWTRPSAMSWGFFLYVNWFNPGQAYAFYAVLEQWPALLLTQDVLGCFAQAAGFAGLLLFVLRAPNDRSEPEWRYVEMLLPAFALAIALVLLVSYGDLVGFRTEEATRAGIILGFPVAICAVAILLIRRKAQTPEEYQRLRWVIWGCLIGLPAFLIAELATETAAFVTPWGDFRPSEPAIGLLFLVNGVLCLFVFEAVRRQRVVSVAIPLRRVTILTFLLSAPILLLDHQAALLQEELDLPIWAWLFIAVTTVFVLTQLHEFGVDAIDRFFNRELEATEHRLIAAIRKAADPADLDRLLSNEPFHALKLTSAASFRCREGAAFVRHEDGNGWNETMAKAMPPDSKMLDRATNGEPFRISDKDETELNMPPGLGRPVLAVPAINPVRCFALSFYGPHVSGTDLDFYERSMLAKLASHAAAMYAELESAALRGRIAELEGELKSQEASKGQVHGDLRA